MSELPAMDRDPVRAVFAGMLVMLAGTVPRNIIFAANLRFAPNIPWAVPLTAGYLWLFWRFVRGDDWPFGSSEWRRTSLRANRVSPSAWIWSLLAGGFAIVALVLALRVANRLMELPVQTLPEMHGVPESTVLALLVMAAPVAGVVEEAAFRGYMQQPIERRFGVTTAILVTGTMFALAHLDFTLVLWPYYVAVAAIYGTVAYLSGSILPAVVLHTAGNLYSNIDLFRHGNAEWQASIAATSTLRETAVHSLDLRTLAAMALASSASLMAFRMLRRTNSVRS